MARKYICDNCGKETGNLRELYTLNAINFVEEEKFVIGEFCKECINKLAAHINGGFS